MSRRQARWPSAGLAAARGLAGAACAAAVADVAGDVTNYFDGYGSAMALRLGPTWIILGPRGSRAGTLRRASVTPVVAVDGG
jgi:hypothetical protein